MPTGTAAVHVRPVVAVDGDPSRLVEVQELLLELADDPDGDGVTRVVEVGRKRLPDDTSDSPNWGHVRAAGTDADEVRALYAGSTYATDTLGTREQHATVLAAEGDWDLRRSGSSTFLRLRLERRDVDEGLFDDLQLRDEAVYALTVKNPLAPGEPGLAADERAELPDALQDVFDGNRWSPADPLELLDHVGVELVLVPASA